MRAVFSVAVALLLASCSGPPPRLALTDQAEPAGAALRRPIAMDGRFDDWPGQVTAAADGQHLYFRLRTAEPVTLQGAEQTYALRLDLDGSAATGLPGAEAQSAAHSDPLGVDLEVQFSPFTARRGRTPDRGQAVRVLRFDAAGQASLVSHAQVGLLFSPTHSSDEFEIRLDRPAKAPPAEGVQGAAEPLRARFATLDASGNQTGASSTMTLDLSTVPAIEDGRLIASIPSRAPDELRIVTLNVEFAGTLKTPEPFGRILRALDPDIVLIQEWDKGEESEIAEWFRRHVPPASGWHALRSAGWGVAIASRHPMERLGPELLTRPEDAPPDTHIPDRAIRFVGALVNTPIGDVAAASVHLKCCGYDGSPEDLARVAEAQLINDTFEAAVAEAGGTPLRIIGGDLNLVGSREPLELIGVGLDADGSDMNTLEPWVIGDRSQYTWTDADSAFTPGRLDYVLVSDAALEVSRTFVLDTARLPDDVLAFHGLERSDSAATDHRPIVVDVRGRQQIERPDRR